MRWKGEVRHRRLMEVCRQFWVIFLWKFNLISWLVWRIVVGLSLVPAFGTLYQRLTLPESTRFISAQTLEHRNYANEAGDDIVELKNAQQADNTKIQKGAQSETNATVSDDTSEMDDVTAPPELLVKKAHLTGMLNVLWFTFFGIQDTHFESQNSSSIFQNGRMVKCFSALACVGFSWILRAFQIHRLIIAVLFIHYRFYGINLNQNVVLQQIGYDGETGTPWHRLFKVSTGGIIITSLGFVPGNVLFVQSRKSSQISNKNDSSQITMHQSWPLRNWVASGFRSRDSWSLLFSIQFHIAFQSTNPDSKYTVGILAAKFNTLSKPAFILCFAFLQFFFNFGANTWVNFAFEFYTQGD